MERKNPMNYVGRQLPDTLLADMTDEEIHKFAEATQEEHDLTEGLTRNLSPEARDRAIMEQIKYMTEKRDQLQTVIDPN